jgi:tRNA-specific 2-thiouridylase
VGQIVTTNGDVIGEHAGIHRYTVGQRRGIGIAQPRPLYVLNIDSNSNRVVVGGEDRSTG